MARIFDRKEQEDPYEKQQAERQRMIHLQRYLFDNGVMFRSFARYFSQGQDMSENLSAAISLSNKLTILIAQKVFKTNTPTPDQCKLFKNTSSILLADVVHTHNYVDIEKLADNFVASIQQTPTDTIDAINWSALTRQGSLYLTVGALSSEIVNVLSRYSFRRDVSELAGVFASKVMEKTVEAVEKAVPDAENTEKMQLAQSWSRELGAIMSNTIKLVSEEVLFTLNSGNVNSDDFFRRFDPVIEVTKRFNVYADIMIDISVKYVDQIVNKNTSSHSPSP